MRSLRRSILKAEMRAKDITQLFKKQKILKDSPKESKFAREWKKRNDKRRKKLYA